VLIFGHFFPHPTTFRRMCGRVEWVGPGKSKWVGEKSLVQRGRGHRTQEKRWLLQFLVKLNSLVRCESPGIRSAGRIVDGKLAVEKRRVKLGGKQGPASCTAYLWQVARDKGARGFSDRTTENEWMRRRIMRYLGFGFSPKRPKTQQAQHACFPLSPIFQSPHPLFAGLFSGQLLSSIKTPNLESDGCK